MISAPLTFCLLQQFFAMHLAEMHCVGTARSLEVVPNPDIGVARIFNCGPSIHVSCMAQFRVTLYFTLFATDYVSIKTLCNYLFSTIGGGEPWPSWSPLLTTPMNPGVL